jgi:hypothetical protein
MKTLIEGATAQVAITLVKADGSLETISGYDVAAVWLAGSLATPVVPTCTNVSATEWTVLGPSDGLGGRTASLRVTAVDPVGGAVYIEDYQYLIKA